MYIQNNSINILFVRVQLVQRHNTTICISNNTIVHYTIMRSASYSRSYTPVEHIIIYYVVPIHIHIYGSYRIAGLYDWCSLVYYIIIRTTYIAEQTERNTTIILLLQYIGTHDGIPRICLSSRRVDLYRVQLQPAAAVEELSRLASNILFGIILLSSSVYFIID